MTRTHIIIGGTIGNITEWYNFLLYAYLASVISPLFFPSQNELLSLTVTFTVFALSFFVRPLGGLFFGWIGDTYGRQRALIVSLVMMGIPTLLIGCLPTFDSIGVTSSILLCVFRIFQGLSAGGEHSGSAIYVAEHASASRKTLWVSTVPASAAFGVLSSSLGSLLIVHSFTHAQLLAWGWRVGYWVGTLLCLISILLRIHLPETQDFEIAKKAVNEKRLPLTAVFKNPEVLKKLLIVFSLAGVWGIVYQTLFIWMPTYLTDIQHLSQANALQVNSVSILLFGCLVLLAGYCADYTGAKLLLVISSLAMLIFAYPLFAMLSYPSLWKVYMAMALFALIFSFYVSSAFIIMVESFAVSIRYRALSFGFNAGLAIFGGTCPLIATFLIALTQNHNAPAFYLMLAALTALLTCLGAELSI